MFASNAINASAFCCWQISPQSLISFPRHVLEYNYCPQFAAKVYRVIFKFLREFRPLRYSNRDGHVEIEHVNRGRDTPSFCPTLRVLDMSTLADATDVNPVIKFLLHTCKVCGRNLITWLTSAASPRMDISSTCKVWEKLGVSLPLLTCSPSAWPSRLLYRRGRKSRRDLWITLYNF